MAGLIARVHRTCPRDEYRVKRKITQTIFFIAYTLVNCDNFEGVHEKTENGTSQSVFVAQFLVLAVSSILKQRLLL